MRPDRKARRSYVVFTFFLVHEHAFYRRNAADSRHCRLVATAITFRSRQLSQNTGTDRQQFVSLRLILSAALLPEVLHLVPRNCVAGIGPQLPAVSTFCNWRSFPDVSASQQSVLEFVYSI
jgi:hypothetical protein